MQGGLLFPSKTIGYRKSDRTGRIVLTLVRHSRSLPPYQAEVDVNISVEVSSLVSSADLPVRKGAGADEDAGTEDERERFYLTTAINYTNGAACGL